MLYAHMKISLWSRWRACLAAMAEWIRRGLNRWPWPRGTDMRAGRLIRAFPKHLNPKWRGFNVQFRSRGKCCDLHWVLHWLLIHYYSPLDILFSAACFWFVVCVADSQTRIYQGYSRGVFRGHGFDALLRTLHHPHFFYKPVSICEPLPELCCVEARGLRLEGTWKNLKCSDWISRLNSA